MMAQTDCVLQKFQTKRLKLHQPCFGLIVMIRAFRMSGIITLKLTSADQNQYRLKQRNNWQQGESNVKCYHLQDKTIPRFREGMGA